MVWNRKIIPNFIRMKRFKTLLLVILCLIVYQSKATHIVGGEFELIHEQDYQYRLNLIQYFDEVNGNPEAEDDYVDVYIFRKQDEVLMRVARLYKAGSEFVPYTNPECAKDSLVTRRISYSATIQLPPAAYNDEEGYFVVYERCCRNDIISNLVAPERTGQTFYLEFPPVVKSDKAFVNSSPVFSPPVSDYACIDQPFYYDFRSTDPDGDSLIYTLAVPFNSSTSEALPTPKGYPQKHVEFIEGIGVDNMVPGSPALNISGDGLLSVTPADTGVFVFGVKVEEYRNGVKIGEVRRDFQMLVLDCNPGNKPEVFGKLRGEASFYNENEVIRFGSEDARCIKIQVTDKDPDESIMLKVEGVNFDQDIQDLLPSSYHILNSPDDTLSLDLCLPECPYVKGPMIIDVIAFDNACSQPLSDTLRLTVEYEGEKNEDPFIVSNPNVINVELEAGEVYELPVRGVDNDGDQLRLEAYGEGFDMKDYGMALIEELLVPGEVKKTFRWNADCSLYNFKDNHEFTVFISLSDDSDCSLGEPDILRLNLSVRLPVNNRPKVMTENLETAELTIRIGETLNFNVVAEDKDGDLIRLSAIGNGFDPATYHMNFAGNTGLKKVSAPFSWRLSCNALDLGERSRFELLFIAEDQNLCAEPATDTVRVTILVLPPVNESPSVSVIGVADDTIKTVVGRPVFFEVTGTDPDTDYVILRLAKIVHNGEELEREAVNFSFANVEAYGVATSFFSWLPDCAALSADNKSSVFEVSFTVEDNKCFNAKTDTVTINMQIFDAPLQLDKYEPANAFTPNEDGYADYFYLSDLPRGNCGNRFEKIEIFSRWGNLVFTSDEVDFKWYAQGVSGGTYFYLIHYTKQIYRNQVYVHLPAIEQ